jgi:hypothetical protein
MCLADLILEAILSTFDTVIKVPCEVLDFITVNNGKSFIDTLSYGSNVSTGKTVTEVHRITAFLDFFHHPVF